MSLKMNYCRLCLQNIRYPVETLSKDSKIFTLVTNLFPGMDTSLVINSKLCNKCFKCVQFSNSMIEPVKKNEQNILLNLQNISEENTCRLCLSNEKLETAVCLFKNTNEEARHIIEMAITDLDFDIFRKPVICNSCWQAVKSIYLFKKKCFAIEKILKYYCVSNKINSLDRKELEKVSLSYQEILQQFSENLDKQTFLFDRNAGTICNLELIKNDMISQDMDLKNFSNNGHDIFEEAPHVVNILSVESDWPNEENKIDIIEEKLYKFNESVDMTAGTVHLESLGHLQDTDVSSNASKILIKNNKIVENNCHLIKSPSQPSIDLKKRIHGHNNVLNKSPTKTKLTMQLSVRLEKLLFCDKCDYQTKNMLQLNRHRLCHDSNAEALDSSKYTNSTIRKRNLRNHMKIKNNDSVAKTVLSLKCKKCPYETKEEADNELHLKAHQSKETLKCSQCYYISTCSSSLKKHMEAHETKLKTFKCPKCDYVTTKYSTLITHKLIHQDYNFKCRKCNHQTKRKEYLAVHMLTHQHKYNFSCDKCSFRTKVKTSLVRHMLIHQNNYNFPCDKCNYQAKRKGDLLKHASIHSEYYNFLCGKCSFRAKTKFSLVKHMLVHQENYKFSCDKCNYQAKRKDDLVKHATVHEKDYNFSCCICNYRTKRKGYLGRHMSIHQKDYKFSCDKCSYRTKTKGNLVKHTLIHQEDDNFSCDKCNYQAKRKGDLVKHMVVCHKDYKFSCDKSSYRTKTKHNLVKHKLIHQED